MSIAVDSSAERKSQRSAIPPRPTALPVSAGGIPQELRARRQWVLWRFTWKQREEKWDKPPLQVDGQPAKTNDPTTWTDFDSAYRAYRRGGFDGIGFVPTASDPFTFLDLDHVVSDDGTGTWSDMLRAMFPGNVPEPAALIASLSTHAELSPSGTGIRIICRGELPEGRRKIGGKGNGCPDGLEMYSAAHYLTVTGQRMPAAPAAVNDCTEKLAALHLAVFGKPDRNPASGPSGYVPTVATSLGDLELIEKAGESKGGERFRQLWAGDASAYPSRSEADFALAYKLVFWCGPDAGRVERLMRQSGLARPKWNRRDYLARTITNALEGRTEFYSLDGKRIPCGLVADTLPCPNSRLLTERAVRSNWDKSPQMQAIRNLWVTNPWDCPHAFGAAGRKNSSPCLITATCRKRSCPICGTYWKLTTYRRFGHHIFHHDGQLYVDSVADIDWPAIVKDMRRRAKKLDVPLRYVAIRNEDDVLTVTASIPVLAEIARPIEKDESLALLEHIVDTASMEPRPISSCREWRPLDKPEVERVRGGCSPAAFRATVKAWGATAEGKGGRFIKCATPDLFVAADDTLDTVAESDFWHEAWLRDDQGDAEADAFHSRSVEERKRSKPVATCQAVHKAGTGVSDTRQIPFLPFCTLNEPKCPT